MKRIALLLFWSLMAQGRPVLQPEATMMAIYCHETCDECKYSKSECGKIAQKHLASVSKDRNPFDAWRQAVEVCGGLCPLA